MTLLVSTVISCLVCFQALKCLVAKYPEHAKPLITWAARIEAVFLARYTFDHARQPTPQQPLEAGRSSYHNLICVEVAPYFPTSEHQLPLGIICQDIETHLRELMNIPGSTLADLIVRATPNATLAPPMGFSLLVQYVDHVAIDAGIELALPMAVYAPFPGEAAAGELEVDLSTAQVVHLGPKSLVLRRPNAQSVLKVAPAAKIKQELRIHQSIDSAGCASLRRLVPGRHHGLITGAGRHLAFLELQGWCQPIPEGVMEAALFQSYCTQVRGFVTPGYVVQEVFCRRDPTLTEQRVLQHPLTHRLRRV